MPPSRSSAKAKQAGDPARAAAAMIRITEVDEPPRHVVLGGFGVEPVASKLKQRLADVEAWRDTGLATDPK